MDAATQRKLYLTVKTPGRDLAVKIDAHRVRQVLINFLGNAVKFTNEGGVTLTATFEEETADIGCLTFSVADTGIGISETDKPRVFGMFEQASGLRGTRVANAGTGLGLALCQRLASVMGGKIGLRSELGKGSVFTLTLPHVGYRHLTAEELSALQAEAMSVSSADVKGKVLVVDDVALNLKVMSVMLSRAHIPFVAVGSAAEAIAALEREPF